MKFKMIRIQPLCGEYPSWVPYLSFKEEDYASFLCLILDWRWLNEFSWGRSVCVRGEKKNMEKYCTWCYEMEIG